MQIILAHILGDWYVHFGSSPVRRRAGWAYKRMGVFAKNYHRFFKTAELLGICLPGKPCDSRRGFAHSMMEYSIDVQLARSGSFDIYFEDVRAALGKLGVGCGLGSLYWIRDFLTREQIVSDSEDLYADIESFRMRAVASSNPAEFVFWAGVNKFGLQPCDSSIRFVESFIDEGLQEISGVEIDKVVRDAAGFIGAYLKKFE